MVWSRELDVTELLNAIELGVVVHGPDTAIIDANPRALELLDLTIDQARGVVATDENWRFVDGDGNTLTPAQYPVNLVKSAGQPIRNYKVGIIDSARTSPIWVSCNAYLRETEGTVVVTFVDVSAEHEANQSLALALMSTEQSKQRLLETASRLEIALSAIKAHTYDLDVASSTITFDDDFSPVLGYAPEKLRIIDLQQLSGLTHPADLNKRALGMRALLKGDVTTYQNTARLQHAEGHWVWVENRSKVLARDEAGNPRSCVGVLIDVTARKELESALLRNQKLEALGTLAGGIAHDFNNLLAPILGYTELAKRSVPPAEKEYRYLQRVQKAAERAKQLVLNILLISRTGSSDKIPVSLADLIDEVLVVIEASAPKGLKILRRWSDDLPPIIADATKMYQVVLNLCTNSVQAMSEQGVLDIALAHADTAPSIPDYQQNADGYVVMTIGDNGSGIEQELLERIFDPFFTTKLKGDRRGTGLGLSIVDSVIKDHEGVIDVHSQPGTGTTFTIYLPASADQAPASRPADIAQPIAGSAHIMLVDDETMVLELGESMLEQLGFKVSAYSDGWSALRAFAKDPESYRLVLTDYEMPEISGPDLLRHLREVREDVPVVLLTGYANMATEERSREMGFDSILAKPYDLDALQKTISSVVDDAARDRIH